MDMPPAILLKVFFLKKKKKAVIKVENIFFFILAGPKLIKISKYHYLKKSIKILVMIN